MKPDQCVINLESKGFTLIELLIAVTIIGILAAIALPQYQNFTKKSKAVEATVMLEALYIEERAYFEINGFYSQSLTNLGNPTANSRYFSYNIISLTGTVYTATASPNTTGSAAGLISNWKMSVDSTGSVTPHFPLKGF